VTPQQVNTPNLGSENSNGGGSKGIDVSIMSSKVGSGVDHLISFNCYCLSRYISYWVK